MAYDYGTSNQIIIDFDKDYVPLSDELVYGFNATKGAAAVRPQPAATLSTSDQNAQDEAVKATAKNRTQAPR